MTSRSDESRVEKLAVNDALSEIKLAMAKLDDISRTLIVHPKHEATAREAIYGRSGWKVRVSDHHPDPDKVWILASPFEVRERIGGFS